MVSYLANSPLIAWVSPVVLSVIAGVACIAYYRPLSDRRRVRIFMILAGAAIAFRFLFAGVKTGLQYSLWMSSALSRFLLPPHQNIAIFLHYSWTHFWLNAFISTGAALLFFGILRLLQSHNPRYFEAGEAELGFVMALVVGWPQFIVFIPAVFLLVVGISIVRGVFLHEPYTTLGLPFFIAAVAASLIAGTLRSTALFI